MEWWLLTILSLLQHKQKPSASFFSAALPAVARASRVHDDLSRLAAQIASFAFTPPSSYK
jgi:hypothetical protein